jgi:hypothetical protein
MLMALAAAAYTPMVDAAASIVSEVNRRTSTTFPGLRSRSVSTNNPGRKVNQAKRRRRARRQR